MSTGAELDERIAKCNKILDENPNSQIFAALAEAYRKKGELDKAFRACQNGLRIHPKYGSAHVVMAKINFDKGLYDWAEIEVLKAIEFEGNSHPADLLLGEIYLYKSEPAKATKILNRLYDADPNNQQVQKLLQIARRMPQEQFRKTEPESPEPKPQRVGMASAEKPAILKSGEKINITQLLDNIDGIPGVDGVMLINKEGLVADARWEDERPADEFGAVICDIVRAVKSQIGICKFGQYETILIEADPLVIKIISLKDNLLLIKANKKINLGTLRMRLSSFLSRLDEDFSLVKGFIQ
jgi:predicted regulator of Ras-like GTPase activity (Roadblock/LC7/MglB family)